MGQAGFCVAAKCQPCTALPPVECAAVTGCGWDFVEGRCLFLPHTSGSTSWTGTSGVSPKEGDGTIVVHGPGWVGAFALAIGCAVVLTLLAIGGLWFCVRKTRAGKMFVRSAAGQWNPVDIGMAEEDEAEEDNAHSGENDERNTASAAVGAAALELHEAVHLDGGTKQQHHEEEDA